MNAMEIVDITSEEGEDECHVDFKTDSGIDEMSFFYNEVNADDFRRSIDRTAASTKCNEHKAYASGDIIDFTVELLLSAREHKVVWIPSRVMSPVKSRRRMKRSDIYRLFESQRYTGQLLKENLPLHDSPRQGYQKITMFPIVTQGFHWSLAVFYHEAQTAGHNPLIHYYDSISTVEYTKDGITDIQWNTFTSILEKYNTPKSMGRPDSPELFSALRNDISVKVVNIPEQSDTWECGYYLLIIVDKILQRAKAGVYSPISEEDLMNISSQKCKKYRKWIREEMTRYYQCAINVYNTIERTDKEDLLFPEISFAAVSAMHRKENIDNPLLRYLIKRFCPLPDQTVLHRNVHAFKKNARSCMDIVILRKAVSENHKQSWSAVLVKYLNMFYLYEPSGHIISKSSRKIHSIIGTDDLNVFSAGSDHKFTPFQTACASFLIAEQLIHHNHIISNVVAENVFNGVRGGMYSKGVCAGLRDMFMQRVIMDASIAEHRLLYLYSKADILDKIENNDEKSKIEHARSIIDYASTLPQFQDQVNLLMRLSNSMHMREPYEPMDLIDGLFAKSFEDYFTIMDDSSEMTDAYIRYIESEHNKEDDSTFYELFFQRIPLYAAQIPWVPRTKLRAIRICDALNPCSRFHTEIHNPRIVRRTLDVSVPEFADILNFTSYNTKHIYSFTNTDIAHLSRDWRSLFPYLTIHYNKEYAPKKRRFLQTLMSNKFTQQM